MRCLILLSLFLSALCRAEIKISWQTEIVTDFERIDLRHAFGEWKKEFKKVYSTVEEESMRFVTFVKNWKMISKANKDEMDAVLGLNEFADMSAKEFKLHIHGTEGSCLHNRRRNITYYSPRKAFAAVPDSVDWTTKGVVTPVKNQGQCGSCWAFSTTGSIESRSAIKTGKLVSLSEQQLVDCSNPEGNKGCQGGLMDDAFRYVEKAGGLCTEADYPYKGANGQCEAAKCTKYDPITGYVDVTKDRPDDLEAAVATGPVSVAIEADQLAFQFYRRGVMKGRCGTKLDHGVLVVGYGTDATEGKFWKVKNSWGQTWGENGYFRVCRECSKNAGEGECGILLSASYPTV